MSSSIHSAVFDPALAAPVSTFTSQLVLPNEIDGVTTFFSHFPSSTPHTLPPLPASTIRLLFILSGQGSITQSPHTFPVADMCLFIPHPSSPFTLHPSSPLLALDLHWQLSPTDLPDLSLSSLPYHRAYHAAPTYREAIKSAKTTSRTLLPPHVIPRLAMGSVHTTGEDRVAAHRHPMLEQLFVGLEGTRCRVECDSESRVLGGGEVLHIPLGSEHGVWVGEGELMHYLWIDLFRDKEGTRWIADNHKDD